MGGGAQRMHSHISQLKKAGLSQLDQKGYHWWKDSQVGSLLEAYLPQATQKEHKDQEQNAEPVEEDQYDKDDEDVADMLILKAPGTWIQ